MGRRRPEEFRIGSRDGSFKEKVKDLFFGMFALQTHQELRQLALKYRDIINVLLLGEFMGLPVLGTFYTLRLVPYLIEDIPEITDRVLRERDVLELMHETEGVH